MTKAIYIHQGHTDLFYYSPSESPSGLVSRKTGKPAGSICRGGRLNQRIYWGVSALGKRLQASRVIWTMHHGPIPEGMQIDHINRDATDNRIENLRLATHGENQSNRRTWGQSGYRGVSFDKKSKKWQSAISVDSRTINLGQYTTMIDAARAFDAYVLENGLDRCLNFPEAV